MPFLRHSLGNRFQNLCFHESGGRWGTILSTDWRNLPVKQRNFVETKTSLYKVAWCEFAATNVALSPDYQPKNNADYDRSGDGDPIFDNAIFLRVRRSRLNRCRNRGGHGSVVGACSGSEWSKYSTVYCKPTVSNDAFEKP